MRIGPTEVALEFRFEPGGEVGSVYRPGRWGRFDGGYRQVPWEGHFAEYARRSGVLVPSYTEVGWRDNENLELDWRARISTLSVEGGALRRMRLKTRWR